MLFKRKSSPDELIKSFDKLRQTATSFEDISNWLSNNPKALFENVDFPFGSVTTVTLELSDDDIDDEDDVLNDAIEMGSFVPTVVAVTSMPTKTALPLRNSYRPKRYDVSSQLRRECYLDMSLEAWPLAACHIADLFMKRGLHVSDVPTYMNFIPVLDKHLSAHFGGWTLSKIIDLVDAGVLPADQFSRVDSQVVMKLLLDSRKNRPVLTLPTDLSI